MVRLFYLTTTMSYISIAKLQLSQFVTNPMIEYYQVVIKILKYIKEDVWMSSLSNELYEIHGHSIEKCWYPTKSS